ncbi:MAG: hypothetical protein K5868_05220 [Lachnospiraceae bacterium]|nr:hypothetical protein [Lachnospiraceae bacterium]
MLTQIVLIAIMAVLGISEYVLANKYGKKTPRNIDFAETVIACLGFVILMLLYAGCTGILTSGFHLVDDHETLGIEYNINAYDFWNALGIRLKEDLTGRFRPTYCLIRVIQTYVFRDNFFAWHVMYALISAATLTLAYIYARVRGSYIWMAYAGAMAVFFGGGQSAVLWRLGPQEGMGILLLVAVIIGMIRYKKHRTLLGTVLLSVATVLLGGAKESFLVILPFLPVLLILWDLDAQENVGISDIRDSIKRNLSFICVSYLTFVADMIYILVNVNTKHIDEEYLGEAANIFGIYEYVRGVGASMLKSFLPYFVFLIIGNIIVLVRLYKHRKDENNGFIIRHLIAIVLIDILMATQIVLYVKIHMTERYIIPSSGYVAALWFIEIYRLSCEDKDISKRQKSIYFSLTALFAVILFAVRYNTVSIDYIYPGTTDQEMALDYARDGRDTEAILNKAGELADKDADIIIDLGVENDGAVATYLDKYYSLRNVYGVHWYNDPDEMPIPVDSADIYIGKSDRLISFMEEQNIDTGKYEQYEYGQYAAFKIIKIDKK